MCNSDISRERCLDIISFFYYTNGLYKAQYRASEIYISFVIQRALVTIGPDSYVSKSDQGAQNPSEEFCASSVRQPERGDERRKTNDQRL